MYSFGGTNTDYIDGITVSNDGKTVFGVGSTYSITYGDRDHVLVAFSTSGTGSLLFYKRYGCVRWDALFGATVDTYSNYLYLTGGTSCYNSVSANTWDIPVFKWNITTQTIEWGIIMGNPTVDDYSTRMAFSKYDKSVYMTIMTKDNDGI